jgi:hypothetical protein
MKPKEEKSQTALILNVEIKKQTQRKTKSDAQKKKRQAR